MEQGGTACLGTQSQLSSTSLGERTTGPHLLPESIPSVPDNFKFSLHFILLPDKDFSELRLNRSRCIGGLSRFVLFVVPQNSWSPFPPAMNGETVIKKRTAIVLLQKQQSQLLEPFFFSWSYFLPNLQLLLCFLPCLLGISATVYPYQPCGGGGMGCGHFWFTFMVLCGWGLTGRLLMSTLPAPLDPESSHWCRTCAPLVTFESCVTSC